MRIAAVNRVRRREEIASSGKFRDDKGSSYSMLNRIQI